MNAQTNRRFWLPWLVAISGTVFIGYLITYLRPWGFYWHRLAPFENAHLISDMAAVETFSTSIPHDYVFWSERLGALAGIVILFVIGPSLWIFGETAKSKSGQSSTGLNLSRNAAWYAGVMIVMAGLWYGVNSSVRSFRHSLVIRKISKYQLSEVQLRHDLMTKAFKAVDMYYVPQSEGGAGGSFKSVALNDLIPKRQNSGDVFVTGSVTSDSVITFYAVGNADGRDPTFKNANGEKGKIQLALRVNPTKDEPVSWLKDDRYVN